MAVCVSALAERYPLVVVPSGEKGPRKKGWPQLWPSVAEVEAAVAAGQNLGILLGPRSGVIDFEVDSVEGEASLRKLCDGEPPETPCWVSLRGRHRLYRYDDRFANLGAKLTHPDYPGLEFRVGAEPAQSLIPPSTVSGLQREWEIDLADYDPAPLPESVVARILALQVAPQHLGDDFLDLGLAEVTLTKLEEWNRRAGLPSRVERNNKLRIHYPYCPRKGPHHTKGNSVIFINEDGSHAFYCHHGECQGKTFADLETIYGPFSPPVVKVGPDIHRVAAESIHALRGAPNVYQRGVLVEVTHDAPKPDVLPANDEVCLVGHAQDVDCVPDFVTSA